MATTEDIIRRLIVVAEERGVSQLQQGLQRLAAAGGDFVASQNAVATATTKSERAMLSAQSAVDRIERKVDPAAKALYDLNREFERLSKAAAQGIDPAQINRAAEGLIRMQQAAKDLDKNQVQANEHVEIYQQTLAETEMIEKRLAQTTAERAKRAKEHADYEERIRNAKAGYAAQDTDRHLDIVGASRQPATEQGAGFGALAERAAQEEKLIKDIAAAQKTALAAHSAEQQRLVAVTNEVRQATNAEQEAKLRLTKATIDLAHAQRMGLTAGIDMGKAHEYLAAKAGTATKGTGQLNSAITNLGFQVNDVVTGLATGQAGLTIFAQQAGQIAQAFNQGGGVIPTLSGFASKVAGWFTVTRTALLGVGSAAVFAATGMFRFASAQQEAATTVMGLGRGLGLTRDQFIELTKRVGEAGDMSTATAASIMNTLGRGTRIGADNIKELGTITKDFATTFALSMEDAGKEMTKFGSAQGIEELNRQYPFLIANQMNVIKGLFDAGEKAKGAAIAIAQMRDNLADHTKATGPIVGAWEQITNKISSANMALGEWITKMADEEARAARRATLPQFSGFFGKGGRAGQAVRDAEAAAPKPQGEVYGPEIPTEAQIATVRELKNRAAELSATLLELRRTSGGNVEQEQAALKMSNLLRASINNLNDDSLKLVLSEKELKEMGTLSAEAFERKKVQLENYGFVVNNVGDIIGGKFVKAEDAAKRASELRLQIADAVDAAERKRLERILAQTEMRGQEMTVEARAQALDKEGLQIDNERARTIREDLHAGREQRKDMGLMGEELERHNQLIAKQLQYRSQRNTLSAQESKMFAEEIRLTQESNKLAEQRNKLYQDFVAPGEAFTRVIMAADQALAEGKINANQYALSILDAQIKMEQAKNTMEGGFTAGLLSVQREFGNTSKMMEGFVTSSANSMVTAIADMTDGTKKSGDAFRDLAKTVVRSLEEMVIKTMIVAPIMKALQSAIGGGSGNFLSAIFGGATGGTVKMGQVHTGGIVGFGSEVSRYIDAAAFAGAQRYHRGGLVAGEVPAILRQGEEVLTEGDPRHRMNGGASPTININVNGARGNMEIMDMVSAGVRQGISGYDNALNRGGLARKMTNARVRGQR